MAKSKKKEIYHPDDRFFRKVMSDKTNAIANLETFYPEIAAIADLDTLNQETDEFIHSTLKTFRSDVIYRCRLKNSSDNFYFSLIWEHKLQPDEKVAIQVGLYIFEFLYKLSKAKDRNIEPIIPLIFYNGKEDWMPKTIHELFDDQPQFDFFKRFLPNFDFLFKNITKEPLEELLSIELAFFRSAMMSMAFRHQGNLLIKYIPIIFEIEDLEERLTIANYVLAIIERSPEQLIKEFENKDFQTKSNIMSTLAMLKAEGKAEGIIEGKAEGKVEGKVISSLSSLLFCLSKHPTFSFAVITEMTGFKKAKINLFIETLKTEKRITINTFITKEFLKKVKLSIEEQKNIDALVKKTIQHLKSKN